MRVTIHHAGVARTLTENENATEIACYRVGERST